MSKGKPVLLLACGALAREIIEVQRIGGWEHVVLECLPAQVHNTPEKPLICYRYPWEKDDIPECSYEFEPAPSQIASLNNLNNKEN